MKGIFNKLMISCALVAGLSLYSCEKPVELQPEPAIEIADADLVIPAKGGEATFTVNSDVNFTATAEKSWLSVSVSGKTVTASAEANDDLNSRYSKLVVKGGDETVTLTIQQLGLRTSGFEPKDIVASADAATFTFPYSFDEQIVATCSADWVTLDITDEALTVSLAENPTAATVDNKQRTAEIEWSLGYDKGVIAVVQRNGDFMKPDANWTVTYDGVQKYQDEDAEFITNTVADPTISGKYAINYFSKAEFDAAKLSMADYLDMVFIPQLAEDIKDAAAYYSAMLGREITFADFLYEETDYEIFDIFTPGDYYAVAVGFTDDGEATGHYSVTPFTKKSQGGTPTGYDAWLGEWEVLHGTSTSKYDKWVISEKQKGSTYAITGIEGYNDLSIEAEFDAGSNALVVKAQQEIGVKAVGGEDCSVGFYGATAGGNFWTPGANAYTIFEAKMSGSSAANIEAMTINAEDGETQLELAVYIATTSDGSYKLLKAFADATKIPGAMRRPEGSGGGDNPGSGAKYESWIGEWEIPHGSGSKTDTWKITAKETGSTYSISGIEGYDDLSIVASFDSSTGTITAVAQQEIGVKTVGGEDCAVGFYAATSSGNFWTPGADPYTVFTGVLNGNTATLSPVPVNTQDGEVTPELAVYIASASDGSYKLLKAFADATKIPNTLTKKGSGNGGGDNGVDAILGKWICPSVTDYWGENTYTNWTWNIVKTSNGVEIQDFDIAFDSYIEQYELKCDPCPATLSNNVLIVDAFTPSGITNGGYSIDWIGLEGNSIVDIEFNVDVAKNTITLAVENFGAYIDDDDPGFFSLYPAPVVFYKEGHVPSSVKTCNSASRNVEFKMLNGKKFGMLASVNGSVKMTAKRAISNPGTTMTAKVALSVPCTKVPVKKHVENK